MSWTIAIATKIPEKTNLSILNGIDEISLP